MPYRSLLQIHFKFFFLVLRYLITTGWSSSSSLKTEIIDLSDPTKSCLIEDDISTITSYSLLRSTGGLLGTTPVICGGYETSGNTLNECLLYGTSQVLTMNSNRGGHSSVALNNSMLWILGGYSNGLSDSTEFISIDGAVNGPTLPEAVEASCAVKFPETGFVYLIGGRTPSDFPSNNVWVANPSNEFAFNQGPSLITARGHHTCGTMSIGAKSIIVAAGGNPGFLTSVEILDPLSNQWVAGK